MNKVASRIIRIASAEEIGEKIQQSARHKPVIGINGNALEVRMSLRLQTPGFRVIYSMLVTNADGTLPEDVNAPLNVDLMGKISQGKNDSGNDDAKIVGQLMSVRLQFNNCQEFCDYLNQGTYKDESNIYEEADNMAKEIAEANKEDK